MASHPKPSEPASRSVRLNGTPDSLKAAFLALEDSRDLAKLLDVPYWQLSFAIHRSPPSGRYTELEIRKKAGGTRRILAPRENLKLLQRKLLQVLTAAYRPKAAVHGFAPGRSILTNATAHVGARWLLNRDLQEFFPSVNFGRVRGMLLAKPYSLPERAATAIAQLCCHDNQLPQGAPTSPILANMICGRLDGELLALARRHGMTYTRFADEITLSTKARVFPECIGYSSSTPPTAIVGPTLLDVIEKNRFRINSAKCRLQGRETRQEVTGLTVNAFPNVPRTFVRRTRAMLHAWEKCGFEQAEAEHRRRYRHKHRRGERPEVSFKQVIRGHLAYLRMVRGESDPLLASLRSRYAALDSDYVVPQTRALDEVVRSALWVLASDDRQGTGFYMEGVGLVTCDHAVETQSLAFRGATPSQTHRIRILARSESLDLAVVSFHELAGPSLSIRSDFRPKVGDQVVAAGFPNYQDGDLGHWIDQRIASFRRVKGLLHALVSGPIAYGMSGGPVVDQGGQVVGVVVSGAPTFSAANFSDRHGFIPAPILMAFLTENGFLIDR